ncbi:MAG: GNAT family N-acetyltransferase [Thermoplasmata archaeon]|nr:MAG: GNAT family N-acetyltransferase [Thermoplasmata archaeon]
MMIRQMEPKDVEAVSSIHSEALGIGFLSTLGEDFLSTIYEGIATSKLGVMLVYEEDSRVVGFVAGSTDTKKLFRDVYRKKLPYIAKKLVFKTLRRPDIIKNLLLSSQYPEMAGDPSKAELLAIAVHRDFRGAGIGRELVSALIDYFEGQGVSRFRVSVDRRLSGADAFYEKMGFELSDTVDIYDKKMDFYVYDLQAGKNGVPWKEKTSRAGFYESTDWDSHWQEELEGGGGAQRFAVLFRKYFGDEYVKQVVRLLPSQNPRILEVGCGTAYSTQELGKMGYKAYALDYSPQVKRFWEPETAQFLIADGFHIPLKGDSFDVVWNAGVLEHFSNPQEMVEEMIRVCRPGGVVCVFVPYLFDITAHLKLYGEENIYTKKKLREELRLLDDVGIRVLYQCGGMIVCGWGRKRGQEK